VTGIGVILGSTRTGRRGEPVARWVMEQAGRRSDADFELVDLADYPLPHLDEPLPTSPGQYQNAHTQQWASPHQAQVLDTLFREVIARSQALAPLRHVTQAA
jgi:NAD(P)H-dependent FMN reductase